MPLNPDNLAEGRAALGSFIDVFNAVKGRKLQEQQLQQQQAERDRQEQIMLADRGLVKDPATGLLQKSPQKRQEEAYDKAIKQAGLLKTGYKLGQYDDTKNEYALERDPNYKPPMEWDPMKMAQYQDLLARMQDRQFEKTPKGRLEKAGGEVKKSVGFITSAFENLSDYEKAFEGGGRQGRLTPQTPFIGGLVSSTPIDDARVNMEEAIGRLASGGAIGQQEETRFRQMLPTAADNNESSKRKLAQLRSEMENKLTGYGFKTEELGEMGFDPNKLGYGEKTAKQEGPTKSGGLIKQSQAKEQMVSVINPNGEEGEIPASRVNDAVKNGYKVIK